MKSHTPGPLVGSGGDWGHLWAALCAICVCFCKKEQSKLTFLVVFPTVSPTTRPFLLLLYGMLGPRPSHTHYMVPFAPLGRFPCSVKPCPHVIPDVTCIMLVHTTNTAGKITTLIHNTHDDTHDPSAHIHDNATTAGCLA